MFSIAGRKNERVIRGRVQFARQHLPHVGEGIQGGTNHLRRTTEGIIILNRYERRYRFLHLIQGQPEILTRSQRGSRQRSGKYLRKCRRPM